MLTFYRQFSQGISVAACSLISFSTLGYMMDDINYLEKTKMKSTYEKQITVLNEEIERQRTMIYDKYDDKLNLKY